MTNRYPQGEVEIKEENKKTGGHYGCETLDMSIPATIGWHNFDYSWPIPISLLAAQILINTENVDDKLECHIAPDTTVGVLSAQMDSGTNVASFSVPSGDEKGGFAIFVGMWIEVGGEDLGRILSIATDGTSVTTENNASTNIAASSLVKVTIKMSPNCLLPASSRYVVGDSKIGGSYIDANKTVRIRYKNEVATAKDFSLFVEYLY